MPLHLDRSAKSVLFALLAVGLVGAAAAGGQAQPDRAVQPGGNVTVLAANGSVADEIERAADARSLRADGRLRAVGDDDPVVAGDTTVVRIRSERVDAAVAETDGANATERFFRAVDGPDANVTVRALVGPQRQPYELSLERSDSHVVRDRANATLYVVVDTRSVVYTELDSDERVAFEPGHSDFSVEVETRGDGETGTLEARFEFVGPDATVRSTTGALRFAGGGPARVDANASTLGLSGYANLLPGENVTVRAEGPNGTTFATDRVTTTENASADADREDARSDFAAALRGVPADEYEWFRLRATGHNRTIWERRVVVGPEPRWSNLSATAVETDGDTWTLRVNASLRLPDEGILAVELGAAADHFRREVSVPEGRSHQRVSVRNLHSAPEWPVELEVYWDSRDDGEYVFPEDRTFGTSANVTAGPDGDLYARMPVAGVDEFRTPTATPTPSPTASPTPTATPSPTGADSPASGGSPTVTATDTAPATGEPAAGETTTADGPGFGTVAALVAMATGVAAAARRR